MENNNINIENDSNMNYFQIFDNFLSDNNNNNLDNPINNPNNNNNNNNNINNQFQINNQYESKITSTAMYAFLRFILLYICYLFSKSPFNPFLSKLVIFLLIHDALVITNYTLMKIHLRINYDFPQICLLFEILNRMIFFVWFLYGNLLIIFDENNINDSLKNNTLMTYYIIILILLGFFIFADYIFYIILFITFFPCIVYILYNILKERKKLLENIKKINSILKEINYEDYTKTYGRDYMDICVICSENFKNGDKVIVLPCNNHHIFHGSCIRAWIQNKTICPMCRKDLNLYVNNENDNEEENQINII